MELTVQLPISKSIANRLLIIYAMQGGDGALSALRTFPLDNATPDDVRLLHTVLSQWFGGLQNSQIINIFNCGTAMRFLTAFFAARPGSEVTLCGVERMHQRPVGQLVDALRLLGADIEYLGNEGFPPLRIRGRQLDLTRPVTILSPQSTQFVSALLLIGADVRTDSRSPYIHMTRALLEQAAQPPRRILAPSAVLERDWSSAAFWYEYVAIHGGTVFFPDLSLHSLQGDRAAADLFARLGVTTTSSPATSSAPAGITISAPAPSAPPATTYAPSIGARNNATELPEKTPLAVDFSHTPDLYPPFYAACWRLGIPARFTGLDSLPLKESNRLSAMHQIHRAPRELRSNGEKRRPNAHDHRIAMALLMADCPVDDTTCISKSYPLFMQQWNALHA